MSAINRRAIPHQWTDILKVIPKAWNPIGYPRQTPAGKMFIARVPKVGYSIMVLSPTGSILNVKGKNVDGETANAVYATSKEAREAIVHAAARLNDPEE